MPESLNESNLMKLRKANDNHVADYHTLSEQTHDKLATVLLQHQQTDLSRNSLVPNLLRVRSSVKLK